MKIYHGFKKASAAKRGRAVAIGIFDGVHLGHQKILKKMISTAKAQGAVPAVVTFDPHPIKLLAPKKYHPTLLMSLDHRIKTFEALGVKEVFVIPFTKAFSAVSHEKFLNDLLIKKLKMVSLAVGHDFRFGHKAQGTISFLKSEAHIRGFGLNVMEPVKMGREIISSTRIRALIEEGRLKRASAMLGRPVSVVGTVIRGRGRGHKIGFPTANLDPHHEALPPSGVYSAYGYFGKQRLKGVIHIGIRPTFADEEKSLEVHFLNFHRTLYGKEIELRFVSWLRAVRRFSSPEALQKAIANDILRAKKQLF